MKTIRYNIKPLDRKIRYRYQQVIEVDSTLKKNESASFWSFLSLDFRQQLDLIAYKYLKNRNKIVEVKKETESSFEYEEINTDDIFESCRSHILNYYHLSCVMPKYLFVGNREMLSLTEHCYRHHYSYGLPERDIRGVMSRYLFETKIVVTPWMDGVFAWSGEGIEPTR